jgi:hypothetical protein
MSDPLHIIKYIAYNRTTLEGSEISYADLVNFAKWQLCQARNKLWLDSIWDRYTDEEILAEFFSIKFDTDAKSKEDFKNSIMAPKADDMAWFDSMEQKILGQQGQAIIKEDAKPEETKDIKEEIKEKEIKEDIEFEDTF